MFNHPRGERIRPRRSESTRTYNEMGPVSTSPGGDSCPPCSRTTRGRCNFTLNSRQIFRKSCKSMKIGAKMSPTEDLSTRCRLRRLLSTQWRGRIRDGIHSSFKIHKATPKMPAAGITKPTVLPAEAALHREEGIRAHEKRDAAASRRHAGPPNLALACRRHLSK